MKHWITDEKIHEIYNYADIVGVKSITEILKELFPEAFLQKGKWYQNEHGTIICYSGNLGVADCYGFKAKGQYAANLYTFKSEVYQQLRTESVIELLLTEARKQGLAQIGGIIEFDDVNNILRYSDSPRDIFNNGKWADKIEPISQGDWYRHESGIIRFFSKGKSSSVGFTLDGYWSESKDFVFSSKYWKQATELEVHFALMLYVYTNYKPGDKIKCAHDSGRRGKTGSVHSISFHDGNIYNGDPRAYMQLYNDKHKRWAEKC